MATDAKMLFTIAFYGYSYKWCNGKFVVFDPLDGVDGFYLTVDSVHKAYTEMVEHGLLGEGD